MSALGNPPVVVIGAGPAGLTAAYELSRRGIGVAVYEASDQVGGIARTVLYNGYRFDVGGHRFFTKIQVVRQLWEELLGDDLLEAERLSRIYYDGRFLRYPLAAVPTLKHLGLAESLRTLASYLRAKLPPRPPEDTLEGWIVRRFGRRLYETFFASYTEKVWGVPGSQISAEWAAQRIQGLSLSAVVANAVLGTNGSRSLIQRFHYPALGPGMLWERCAQRTRELGGEVELQRSVVRLDHAGGRVRQVTLRLGDREEDVAVEQVLSSMPIPELLGALDPPPPPHVRAAAERLRHRSLVVVCLIIAREQVFPDHWIYVHDPGVRVGRIQNFKNWSRAMVPDPSTSSLGLEYFCDEGDDLWRQDDGALVGLAGRELERLGLAGASTVSDGLVIRQPHAYPTYDAGYAESLASIRTYLAELTNLQTIGRSGLHRYNNQDHSMLTALLAVRNLLGERHDLWRVNTEASSHEG